MYKNGFKKKIINKNNIFKWKENLILCIFYIREIQTLFSKKECIFFRLNLFICKYNSSICLIKSLRFCIIKLKKEIFVTTLTNFFYFDRVGCSSFLRFESSNKLYLNKF